MTDPLLQTLAMGVVVVLLAFELVVAFASWMEVNTVERSVHRAPVLLTHPFAIREHFRASRRHVNALRSQYPVLRSPDHGHRSRDAIRRLQPTDGTLPMVGCSNCRGSRMRGLPRCPACGQRLIAPAHASRAQGSAA